jgi:hypothetical protein
LNFNAMKPSIDPTQLQRLVDGECAPGDVRAVLLAAKNDPACWEQIAVALLEDRAWQCQIQSQPNGTFDLERTASALAQSQLPTQATNKTLADAKPTQRVASALDQASRLLTWFAMAASLFAVAVLGYSIGQHRSISNSDNIAQSPKSLPADSLAGGPTTGTRLASLRPDYRMQLPATDRLSGGDLQPAGEVPLYAVNSMVQWRELDRPQSLNLTPRELAELNARGIGVQKDFDVLSGELEDGRVFVVPIRSIRFAPWQ